MLLLGRCVMMQEFLLSFFFPQFLQGAETLKKVVMRRAMGMLQILVLLIAIVNGMSLASALYGPSSDVVILTSSNFKSKVLHFFFFAYAQNSLGVSDWKNAKMDACSKCWHCD
jgi:hypothetical protein